MIYLETAKKAEQRLKRSSLPEDPVLSLDQWYPHFRDFHHGVIAETADFDYGWLRTNRPDLYQSIKAKENELDALGEARLSEVMEIMGQWRALILQAELEVTKRASAPATHSQEKQKEK